MVCVTVLSEVRITDTVLDEKLATYTLVPSGLTATPVGSVPTVMVCVTAFVAVLITDTVPPPWLVT